MYRHGKLVKRISEIFAPPPAPEARVITLVIVPQEDGGLRVSSPDLRALHLSGAVPSAVLRDIGPALDRFLFGVREAKQPRR